MAERGITVDHVTIYRWVQGFTAEFIEAARPCRRLPGDRWFIDETYVKISGRWSYLFRAIDQHGQVVDVMLFQRRDLLAARAFFVGARAVGVTPTEVTTDRAPAYPRALDECVPAALHVIEQYANNPVEADHGRLRARLRRMPGTETLPVGSDAVRRTSGMRSGSRERQHSQPICAQTPLPTTVALPAFAGPGTIGEGVRKCTPQRSAPS